MLGDLMKVVHEQQPSYLPRVDLLASKLMEETTEKGTWKNGAIMLEASTNICDRINTLPDDMLVRILSFLELTEKIKTSLLSNRWRYLWTYTSCLDFDGIWKGTWKTDRANFIDKLISNHRGSKIEELKIFLEYKVAHKYLVDSWIDFAIKRKVEHLNLDLYERVGGSAWFYNDRYKLPSSLLGCGSITSMTLVFCDLNMPAPINLTSLKTLHFDSLDLSAETITQFTSSCPMLEDLSLSLCNRDSNLNIVIENHKLRSLTITEFRKVMDETTEIVICAPSLLSLRFRGSLQRRYYHFKNLKSIEVVSFCRTGRNAMSFKLLRNLSFVKELRLCMGLVEDLSSREVEGLPFISFNTTYLKVATKLTKWELPGLLYLLKGSPKLESLIIEIPDSEETVPNFGDWGRRFLYPEKCFWEMSSRFFCDDAWPDLKYIKIPFLSGNEEDNNVNEILQKLENKIELTRFLLEKSKALRLMEIQCFKTAKRNYELLFKLTKRLIDFPRASPYAKVNIV